MKMSFTKIPEHIFIYCQHENEVLQKFQNIYSYIVNMKMRFYKNSRTYNHCQHENEVL